MLSSDLACALLRFSFFFVKVIGSRERNEENINYRFGRI